MEIKINDQSYAIKYTLRAMFLFEQITQKMFDIKTITDEYIYFYCLLIANNPDIQLTFNDFINVLDEDPTIMIKYQKYISSEIKKQNQFIHSNSDNKKKS